MAEEEGGQISVKLKVHYTFDADHKVDHLSRPAQSYQVDTAPIDDSLTIGIIDLRSCLDAIISSSPELTHFNESDYTLYAYDYSEPNTPLVGQGMLSKVLSQDESSSEAMITGKITKSVLAKLKKNVEPFLEVKLRLTPIASAVQRGRSGSMSSVHEGMQQQWPGYSQAGPIGPDRPSSPADMSRLENVHRTLHEGRAYPEGGLRRESSFNGSYPWGAPSRPSSRPGTPIQAPQYLPPPPPGSSHSRHGSQFINYGPPPVRRGSESGYGSGDEFFDEGPARKRAKIMKVQKAKKNDFNIEQQPNSLRTAAMGASSLRIHQPAPMNPTQALQHGFSAEEPVRPPTPIPKGRKPTGKPRGRPRKNREAENAEPSSPQRLPEPQLLESSFSSPEEARAGQQAGNVMSSPDNIPSSPPVFGMNMVTSPNLPEHRSPLAQTSSNQDSGFFSANVDSVQVEMEPKEGEDVNQHSIEHHFNDDIFNADMTQWFSNMDDSAMNVDPNLSLEDNPNHFTPVFDDDSVFGGPTPQPDAQPKAPTPAQHFDSAQQKGQIATSQAESDKRAESVPAPRPGPQTIPTPILQPTVQPQLENSGYPPSIYDEQFQRPALPAHQVSYDKQGRPMLAPGPPPAKPKPKPFQRSKSALPPVPASDPGRRLERSNTWAPEPMSDAIMSDAAGSNEGRGKGGRKRIGKEQTQARLEAAIATGCMPPYCYNCGAIETPAWRRGYIKNFTCPIDSIDTSLDQGKLCYKQPVNTAPDGTITSWKGWKVEKVAGEPDDEWEQINLCNPCGLWFHKTKTPRPAEKWQKKDPKEKRKRKRPPKPPKSRTNPPRAAAGNLPTSDAQEPGSEDSSPADTSAEDGADDSNENNDNMTVDGDANEDNGEPELPPMPQNVLSAQLGRRTVKWAEVPPRLAQSSPAEKGSVDEPIDLLTPNKPLRRKLFSPSRVEAESPPPEVLTEKVNGSLLPSFVRRSPRLNKTRDIFSEVNTTVAMSVDGAADDGKENVTPGMSHNFHDFDDLFGDNDDELMLPPATPTPKRRSERILLRTPGKTPTRDVGAENLGNAQTTPKRNRTPKSEYNINVAELFMDSVTRSLDPNNMTPNTRRLFDVCSDAASPSSRPSRLRTGFTPKATTPGRSSVNFDFPDLPSLKPSSPMSNDVAGHSFSELPTERIYDDLNTDMPMPSSPPVHGWGAGHEDAFGDMVNFSDMDAGGDWGDFLKTPKKQCGNGLLDVETPGRSGLRRSPRRVGHEQQ